MLLNVTLRHIVSCDLKLRMQTIRIRAGYEVGDGALAWDGRTLANHNPSTAFWARSTKRSDSHADCFDAEDWLYASWRGRDTTKGVV